MSKDFAKQKNQKSTNTKSDPTAPGYAQQIKNKANEHTPYGEAEPSTETTFK